MLSSLRARLCLVLAACTASEAAERPLTTALEVRSLSPADAARGIPVRLRGVVVFIENQGAMFLQDETSTTFFRVAAGIKPPAVGDEIEVTSKSRLGLYLPGLDDSEFRVLGRRALPPGIPAQFDDLHFGRYHYQRVTVEGVVRSVRPIEPRRSLLRLAMGSRVIDVRVEAPPPEQLPIDHRVRVTGLAVGLINTPRRQLVQPYLRVLGWDEIAAIEAAPPAAEAPLVSAEELLAFRVSGLGERRVRLEGTVAAAFGEQIFLREGPRAFVARLAAPLALAAGERVILAGFPSMERFSASVADAEVLTRLPGEPPEPIEVATIDELYGPVGGQQSGRHDGSLVRVNGRVRDTFKTEEGVTLAVEGLRRTAHVQLPAGAEPPPVGAVVRITGACQVETTVFGPGFRGDPGSVSLRLATPGDLVVLRAPPWWTQARLATGLSALVGVVLLSALWIALLRRQVGRQTAALRHRIEAEAALEERQRIAREFHDTLEQELAGVSLRLDALATRIADEKGRTLVENSRHLVARIQSETRDLIGDLRDPAEAAGDLVAALEGVAARHNAESGAEVRLDSAPNLPLLPAATVHDLRMIAREAVTNALRHGRARRVVISVEAAAGRIVLRVIDNGCGFDPGAALQGKRGHFGCAGMRERARKIGATVTWRSLPGEGATVEVILPAPNR
ncbi:MAG: sensor histidine kinase [Opitutaceae bacterium]|nr:sensor histidine kinase [Opitutaceae bacterium]